MLKVMKNRLEIKLKLLFLKSLQEVTFWILKISKLFQRMLRYNYVLKTNAIHKTEKLKLIILRFAFWCT